MYVRHQGLVKDLMYIYQFSFCWQALLLNFNNEITNKMWFKRKDLQTFT